MTHFWPLVLSSLVGVVMGGFFLFAAMRRLGPRRTNILFAINAPIAACLGWLLLAEVIGFEVLLSVLLGVLILHEPVGPTKIMATLLMLLGFGLTQKAQAP